MIPTTSQSEDYYFTEEGMVIFTAEFLKKRGSCCGNGCLHCPYNYDNVPEHLRARFLKNGAPESQNGSAVSDTL